MPKVISDTLSQGPLRKESQTHHYAVDNENDTFVAPWAKTCLICKKAIQTIQGISDVKHHYGLCYYKEGAFHELFPPMDLIDGKVHDERSKKYTCTFIELCTKRKMGYKEFCMHMGTSHEVVSQIMAKDVRGGMDTLIKLLYPNARYLVKSIEIKQEELVIKEVPSTNPPKKKRIGPASRIKLEVESSEPLKTDQSKALKSSENPSSPIRSDISPPKKRKIGPASRVNQLQNTNVQKNQSMYTSQSVNLKKEADIVNDSSVSTGFGHSPLVKRRMGPASRVRREPINQSLEKQIINRSSLSKPSLEDEDVDDPEIVKTSEDIFSSSTSTSVEEVRASTVTKDSPVKRRMGPASRVRRDPYNPFLEKPLTTAASSSLSIPSLEDEDVDDPSPKTVKSSGDQSFNEKVRGGSKKADSPPVAPPRIDRIHQCLVCGGQGKANKEGRNLNMGDGLQDMKYHYAVCYYNQGNFREFIDPGNENLADNGEPLEEFGFRFKYKCPFPTCSRNTGRGAGKMMGYKEYSIHCGVAHHVLEKVMAKDQKEGIDEVISALRWARKRDGQTLEAMPPVQVEEVHTCLLCNGETKDGKNLSFAGSKRLQLRYHYAACYYDSGIYLSKYPPGDQNTDEDGNPKDILGRDVKYSCEASGCTVKRKMGYKEFCIHMSNEHRGILDLLREDGRPGLIAIADKLEEGEARH